MAIKQFSIGFSRTINLGNFESARVEAQIIVEIDSDSDYDMQVNAAQGELRALLEDTWRSQFKARDRDEIIRR